MKIGILIVCLTLCWWIFFRPDPENKRKFKKTLGIELTPDVEDIHYYYDYFPTDYAIFIAFTCDSSTIWRIVSVNGLKLGGDKDMGGLSFKADWWDEEKISTLIPFKKEKERFYQYLWYDKENKKAYYQEFSI
ncbi:MAG: hypothetical protein LBV72_07435 [Tannerella sp.]|jgi:hypothetical protein|nr:hypothetical protein [Tannerella sp.]